MKLKILTGTFLLFTLFSCSSKPENSSTQSSSSYYSNEENNDESDEENDEYSNGCKFENGTYSATVDYFNPETGYSATYTLDVEVQDCQIVQINFPNDGYLDEDHISYADIDEDGNAIVEGEDGKSYEIQIDD
jgi:hypothetical protein